MEYQDDNSLEALLEWTLSKFKHGELSADQKRGLYRAVAEEMHTTPFERNHKLEWGECDIVDFVKTQALLESHKDCDGLFWYLDAAYRVAACYAGDRKIWPRMLFHPPRSKISGI